MKKYQVYDMGFWMDVSKEEYDKYMPYSSSDKRILLTEQTAIAEKDLSDDFIALISEQKMFREKHMIRIDPQHNDAAGNFKVILWKWNWDNNVGKWERIGMIQSFETYDSALSTGLVKAREILINDPLRQNNE